MPTFDTPEPISVAIDIAVGDVRITAGDRADTVVQVRPTDSSQDRDARAAEQTRVEYAAGRLLVKGPKPPRLGLWGKVGSVDVTIELPAGSHLRGDAAMAAFRCVGRLGECRVKVSAGDIQLDHADTADLDTSVGAIVVDRVTGHADVATSSGKIRLAALDGTAVVKNSNGDSWVGHIAGDLRVNAANGSISVDHAGADVTARTANGDVRIGEVVRGVASLKTAYGEIEVGIRAGTPARLDVSTQFGRVRNRMDTAATPEPSEDAVEVSARTSYGDIVIHRS